MTEVATARCLIVEKHGDRVQRRIDQRSTSELGEGDVLVRVAFSALNYKDALAATGHPGVARGFPHVPGLDAAGTVIESTSELAAPGDQVIVAHELLGTTHWGGWSDLLRVPAGWTFPLPVGLSVEEAMTLGTAGFTAAQSCEALQAHGVFASSGPIVVTGATGGVGIFAVKILSQLGYDVTAVSGKTDKAAWLKQHGAADVVGRAEFVDGSPRPLLSARWAGAIDTVGGEILGTALRSTMARGCVAACGLVGGHEIPVSVYPFILRGITLQGIDSAHVTREERIDLWKKLAGVWRPDDLAAVRQIVSLDQLDRKIDDILAGKIAGRIVIGVA